MSSSGKNPVLAIIDDIGKDFEKCKPLVHISSKIGVPPGQIAVGSFALVLICIICGFCSNFLTAVVGFLYPSYMSFKAIESIEEDDDKQWLTYWVVFAFLHVFDAPLSVLLQFIPFYYPLKVMFIVYLFYPRTKGALVIYNNILRKFLKENENSVDNLINRGKKAVNDISKDVSRFTK